MQARYFKPMYIITAAIIVGLALFNGDAIYSNFIEVPSSTPDTTKRSGVFISEINEVLDPSNPNEVVEYASKEWTTNGGDFYNRRYSTLDQINVDTINDLSPAWATSLGSGSEMKFSGEATPIIQDGVMYIATGANDVLALDATTGEIIWEFRPEIEQKMDTVCCGWTTRGVAVGDGKVYAGLLDARLVALDIKTGELLWETEVADWEKGYTITSAPLYYNGKIYTGVSGGEYGIRGRVMAYDSDLGREIWRSIPFQRLGTKTAIHGQLIMMLGYLVVHLYGIHLQLTLNSALFILPQVIQRRI